MDFILATFLLSAIILKYIALYKLPINQDEYFYLSKIFDYQRGSLSEPFQTFHVHFFGWITLIKADEIKLLFIIRNLMFVLFLSSCIFIYFIGNKFINRTGCFFAILCYFSLSYTIFHGASFRSDTISTFLFLLALLFILRDNSFISVFIAGIALSLSFLITIKSIFYIITAFIVLYLYENEKTRRLKKTILLTSITLLGSFSFYFLHTILINYNKAGGGGTFIKSSATKVFNNPIFPQFWALKLSFIYDQIIWLLFFYGLLVIWKRNYLGMNKLLLAFVLPITTIVFYRNSFPYYYVFIFAPSILICGVVAHDLAEDSNLSKSLRPLLTSLAIYFLVYAHFIVFYSAATITRTIDSQKTFITHIHKMFPNPVPYIDGCSMISSFPKMGFFMSSWGMGDYLRNNVPIMKGIVIEHQPKLLIANVPALDISKERLDVVDESNYSLLEEDWHFLKDNFIKHWGPLYIPGKRIQLEISQNSKVIELFISGYYLIESGSEIQINELECKDGDILFLEKGYHEFYSNTVPTTITIKINVPVVNFHDEPIDGNLFVGQLL